MRNLTITRRKSFVASLVKMKVYIEDPTAGELMINNVPCRKLGELKNGETVTFPISESGAKVYIIADKLSKNYCNEFYTIPEGEEDVVLSGQNCFNPIVGNPFRFDHVTDEEVLANRKKTSRKGIVVFVAAIIVGFSIGFFLTSGILSKSDKESEPKVFSDEGMSITLTDEFDKVSTNTHTAVYSTEEVVVFALKEPFTLAEGMEKYTLIEYGNSVLDINGMASKTLQKAGDLVCFEYEAYNEENKVNYAYFAVVYKSSDAFWLVQFATSDDKISEYRPIFIEWANTVEFSGS